MARSGWLVVLGGLWAATAAAEPLTADRAVQLALQKSSQIIQAEASLLDARGGALSAYSQMLPRVSADWSRGGSLVTGQPTSGFRVIGGQLINSTGVNTIESYSTSPVLSGSWSVLNLSSLSSLSSARAGASAARFNRTAARNEVAFATRRQFYEVVKSLRLAQVADGALRLARDDERRVHALFEVGSVSRSDLLKAQVRTAQSELDSLTAEQAVTTQRLLLATQIGIREGDLGEVDTVLVADVQIYEENSLVAEAGKARPDIAAAEKELQAARASLRAAHWARLPYLSVSGSVTLNPRFNQTTKTDTLSGQPPISSSFNSQSDREWRGSVALSMDLFDGFLTDSRVASARARLLRSQDVRDVLRRNLESEVHQALVAHRAAVEQDRVARRALESATENLKLTQEKYNVGSATILELIDAQVQLQRAQSDGVSALAAIRVAEAQINRVRGRAE